MALFQLKAVFRLLIKQMGIGLFFLFMLLGCENKKSELPFYNSADFTAEWIAKEDARFTKIHKIDTFSMKDQLGHSFGSDSLKGLIYIANFFFTTCPSICPKMTANFKWLQDSFIHADQIKLISFSVMPWVDSVKRLYEYGRTNEINPAKWHLLTGNKERIYLLGRQSFFAEKKVGLQKEKDDFLHTESMLLVDRAGRIRGIYNATLKTDVERVTNDIDTLLKEAL